MLYVATPEHTTTPTVLSVPPRQVRHRDFKKLQTKTARAEFAADLVSGRAVLNRDPQTAGAFCGVNSRYVRAVLRIRKCRPDLAPRLRHEPVYKVAAAAGLGWAPRHRSDAEIDRIVAQIGFERVMQSLDRATRPSVAAE